MAVEDLSKIPVRESASEGLFLSSFDVRREIGRAIRQLSLLHQGGISTPDIEKAAVFNTAAEQKKEGRDGVVITGFDFTYLDENNEVKHGNISPASIINGLAYAEKCDSQNLPQGVTRESLQEIRQILESHTRVVIGKDELTWQEAQSKITTTAINLALNADKMSWESLSQPQQQKYLQQAEEQLNPQYQFVALAKDSQDGRGAEAAESTTNGLRDLVYLVFNAKTDEERRIIDRIINEAREKDWSLKKIKAAINDNKELQNLIKQRQEGLTWGQLLEQQREQVDAGIKLCTQLGIRLPQGAELTPESFQTAILQYLGVNETDESSLWQKIKEKLGKKRERDHLTLMMILMILIGIGQVATNIEQAGKGFAP